jgi:hypothetical protein
MARFALQLRTPVLSLIALAALGSAPLMLSGCGSIGGGLRNEQKGPEGLLVRGGGIPSYKFSKIIPAGITTYHIADIPKGYEVLLELRERPETEKQQHSTDDISGGGLSLQKQHELQIAGIQAQYAFALEAGNQSDRPSGDYGAARAYDLIRRGGLHSVERQNLVVRVDSGAQAELSFVHEVVSVGEPSDEVKLEPFGKVLSVAVASEGTSNAGQITSETREPVYTVSIPAQHRLVVVVKDATGKELNKAVYATWTKNHKYYKDKAKKFFASEEAALASYTEEKDLFAKAIAEGPLFESKKPKYLQDLPVQQINVMSPDDAWGVLLQADIGCWFAMPNPKDPAFLAMGQWFEQGELGWAIKESYKRDSSWVDGATGLMNKVVSDPNASALAKAAAQLNLASIAVAKLDAPAAKSAVAAAQATLPGILDEAGMLTKGGMLDYGSDYYVARNAWLHIEQNINGIIAWKAAGVTNGQIKPR